MLKDESVPGITHITSSGYVRRAHKNMTASADTTRSGGGAIRAQAMACSSALLAVARYVSDTGLQPAPKGRLEPRALPTSVSVTRPMPASMTA